MKIELFSKENMVQKFIDDASKLFLYYIKTEIVETEIGFDIVYKNIELGSYGTRLFNGKQYSYGTGLALPRLSYAIEHSISSSSFDWVANPAWYVPGSHNVLYPFILWKRIIISLINT